MVITQGDIFWADLNTPRGSEPGYVRPVVVVQCDSFNDSRISTVVCVMMTGNVRRAREPGNLLLTGAATGLPSDSVANVSQIFSMDRQDLLERVGRLSARHLQAVLSGIDIVLGR
jgi:mRNA interferase MazF